MTVMFWAKGKRQEPPSHPDGSAALPGQARSLLDVVEEQRLPPHLKSKTGAEKGTSQYTYWLHIAPVFSSILLPSMNTPGPRLNPARATDFWPLTKCKFGICLKTSGCNQGLCSPLGKVPAKPSSQGPPRHSPYAAPLFLPSLL